MGCEGSPPISRPRSPEFVPPKKPTGLRVLLYKFPVYLYRMGLGFLFGGRFLLLTHRGRKTGKIYHTLLEVIRYDPETDESIVVAAYGEKANWYQNIRKNPALEVRTRGKRYVPEQRFLSPEEVYREFSTYEKKYPRLTKILIRILGAKYDGSEEGRRRLARFIKMVGFRPKAPS